METDDIKSMAVALEKDQRLSVWHLALLTAILFLGYCQGRMAEIRVSRSRLMCLSHIATKPTYHKYFRDLQQMDYICYRPSYHPAVHSEVDIIIQPR